LMSPRSCPPQPAMRTSKAAGSSAGVRIVRGSARRRGGVAVGGVRLGRAIPGPPAVHARRDLDVAVADERGADGPGELDPFGRDPAFRADRDRSGKPLAGAGQGDVDPAVADII